jgi:hypothetical protein
MADTKEHGMTIEPAFLLSEEVLGSICRKRAGQNNAQAATLRQEQRVTSQQLADLYYAQGGRCAISGVPLQHFPLNATHPFQITLDHIEKVNRRSSLNAMIDGEFNGCAPLADISNLQWVCREMNVMKEKFHQAGIDIRSFAASFGQQAERGFPIRTSDCGYRPQYDRKEKRLSQLRQLFATHGNALSCREVAGIFCGTELEVHHATIAAELKSLGWRGKQAITEERLEIIKGVCGRQEPFDSLTDAWRRCQQELTKCDGLELTFPGWRAFTRQHGISVRLARVDERQVSSGDLATAVQIIRQYGEHGIKQEVLLLVLKNKKMPASVADRCVESLKEIGRIYQDDKQGTLVASLTRQEAAECIGVSANRLKKFATEKWRAQLIDLPFFKKSEKGVTYYRQDDVAAFKEKRGQHPLDMCVAGQREACVEGGKLGGRPLFADSF